MEQLATLLTGLRGHTYAQLICTEWYANPIRYAGHQCPHDGMIVGRPVVQSSRASLTRSFAATRRGASVELLVGCVRLIPEGSSPPHQYSMPLNCFLTRPPRPRQFYFVTWFRNRHSVKRNPLTWFRAANRELGCLISDTPGRDVLGLCCSCLAMISVSWFPILWYLHSVLGPLPGNSNKPSEICYCGNCVDKWILISSSYGLVICMEYFTLEKLIGVRRLARCT